MDKFLLIFITVLLYVALLLIIRHLGLGSKKSCEDCNNCCPDCTLALNRIKRLNRDKILHHITFRIFDGKRYVCNDCGWEGLRWEEKYTPGGTKKR
jgi:uncharacterized protein with PIN domain